MKLLAFAASSSRNSINAKLVQAALKIIQADLAPGAAVETLDLNDFEMPIFSVDREAADGVPAPARLFFDKISAADALLISFAEHNGSYTAAFKNVYDWSSRIDAKVFQQKPMVALATSPGGRGGATVLGVVESTTPHFGADLRGVFSLPKFYDAFDAETMTLKDPAKAAELRDALAKLF